ncbi:MAG: hypothetical protein J2P17_09440 [Mycobacterium sp.]|nr:hypothetical protein [Mycobacterium sp.]
MNGDEQQELEERPAGRVAVPGMVIDAQEVDAKLITIRARKQPHFTGGDFDMINRHFGKDFSQLNTGEGMVATAYVYLRRAGIEGASWEMAEHDCAIEFEDETMDPTAGNTSKISPPSVGIGVARPGMSTG